MKTLITIATFLLVSSIYGQKLYFEAAVEPAVGKVCIVKGTYEVDIQEASIVITALNRYEIKANIIGKEIYNVCSEDNHSFTITVYLVKVNGAFHKIIVRPDSVETRSEKGFQVIFTYKPQAIFK